MTAWDGFAVIGVGCLGFSAIVLAASMLRGRGE
jgi:hypothetical protein